jgi:hypothetical protein
MIIGHTSGGSRRGCSNGRETLYKELPIVGRDKDIELVGHVNRWTNTGWPQALSRGSRHQGIKIL